ncbi:MAG: fructose-6-phosphate aldolase [Verrucomicrobiota bacterium]|nr:fructose-6-phosphate aldolase [Verrucomicrobiota bacterium]
MQLFIDSSNPKEILQAREWGIIDGVTTNPTLISKGGNDMQETLRRVLEASPGPVFCQVIGWRDRERLKSQARWLHRFSERIIVKLPMGAAGIQALIELKKEIPGIRLAVTAVASVAQAYLCGKAGAEVVAIFNGPLELELDQEVNLIAPVKQIFRNYGFPTRVLSAGRYPGSFGKYAVAGTDICTMRFEFLKLLFEHAFTDKRMNGFLADWKSVFGEQVWPET